MNTNTAKAPTTPFKHYPEPVLYQYRDPKSGQTFELRKLDPEQDLDLFHRWHNQQYVYEFWDLNKSKDELREYLTELISKDEVEPVIGYIDGTPCAYFEVYWAYYDRIAPYCDATFYDRGYHLLIGEKQFLGFNNTVLWLNIVNDFIFKDEPQTRRIVGEPRADNVALLKYVSHTPFSKTKEFDFPHKRAALLECFRDQFYRETILKLEAL